MIELISIHIPKTAGRSFLAILNAVYDPATVSHFDKKNYPDKSIPEAIRFKAQLPPNIRVIHGHFRYSEISNLHAPSTHVIAWLREPVDRVISNFSFFRKRATLAPDNPELQRRKNETLLEYASQENTQNLMSKFTEGLPVNKFFFIGITEFFDTDLKTLAMMLNWPPFEIPRINDNAGFKSFLPVVTEEEKKIIKDLNRKDVDLYRSVLESRKKSIQ